ncbi:kinase-like protein [Sodiomyces alkalinus F11]|uniref:Kinase-like protein n=1 Tax=Sodiomyces alkalinus (strain CBS 110278 / VKM F-3762 / F11) TaxID=1314773 RepID=A0A3N2PMA0_SODAK|nr:kinase-like protein [Sodiomyces alkalinus F11]ROT35599.1 kinase-like protein [Sodiomyces alkalinus F11]
MTAASPTPMGNAQDPRLLRRTSQRQALRRPPSRQQLSRSASQPSQPVHSADDGPMAPTKPESQQYSINESSDDEIPVPMKLSALTKALLKDDGSEAPRPASPPRTRRRASNLAASTSSQAEERRHLRSGSVHTYETRSSRPASPSRQSRESRENSPVRKRVVRLSNTPRSLGQLPTTKRRSTSTSQTSQRSRNSGKPESRDQSSDEKAQTDSQPSANTDTTPAKGVRVVRIAAGSSGNRGRLGSSSHSFRRSGSHLEQDYPDEPATAARNGVSVVPGSESRQASNGSRSSRPEDNLALQSSMRIKRVGKVPGSFLSGPARRGRRRQSEEEAEENADGEAVISSREPDGQAPEVEQEQEQEPPSSFYGHGRSFASGSPVAPSGPSRAAYRRHASHADLLSSTKPPGDENRNHENVAEDEIPFKLPSIRPQLPSRLDQENAPGSTLKRAKPPVSIVAEKELDIPKRPASTDIGSLRSAASSDRKPLASLGQNTPHRPAPPPPPPKMSVLQAATASAGAATTSQGKQRRNIIRVNGKSYTRLDCLGRGGSAKVYRVTAENGAMFALKRVSLEQADEMTIKGYRGEIDLLGKLTGVDRVINLFDYEMNDEKRMLTLLMEMGELDLNSLLRNRHNPESAKFDPVFVRFYWKEMLECLQSVHQYDIVHSDLKPANFVLVKGRLKLIDFGIANAIQTDETVNVHRETQIGTPNYMSPESLMDYNAPRGARVPGRPKLMKLGKPSDIWSLGCILYQMVYGMPPFGHIANQMARCQAIINWDHQIEFPARAMGGVPVPPSLMQTMKRCLNREINMRPTCEELLRETDPFLYPCELHDKALPIDEELLARIIQSVVTRCRERMPTEAEAQSVWPGAYWQSVKKATDATRTS